MSRASSISYWNAFNAVNTYIPHTDVMFTRNLISQVLGGSPQVTVAVPATEKVVFGCRKYICLQHKWNPTMPDRPMADGEMYTLKYRIPLGEEVHFFCNRGGAAGPSWRYMGRYEVTGKDDLPLQEWNRLTTKEKTAWAGKAIGKKSDYEVVVNSGCWNHPNAWDLKPGAHLALQWFEKATTPNLRITRYKFKCLGYNQEIYDALVAKKTAQDAANATHAGQAAQ
jgi:hypothetical protein